MSKIIVTGATGHIGNVLVRLLLEDNRKVNALAMENESLEPLEGLDVDIVRGDVTDREFVFNLIEEGDTVFHLAGIIDIGIIPPEVVEKVNVGGTKNVVDACIEKKAKKLVYTSTVHIIDPVEGIVLTEPEEFNEKKLVGAYAKTKAMATKYILDNAKAGKLDATVVYPSGVIGPYDFKISELGQVVLDYMNKKLLAYVRGGYNFVDVRDVAQGIYSAALKGRSGEGYILSGHTLSLKEMLKMLNKILGRTKLPPKIALWFVKMFASISNLYYKLRNKKPVFSAYSLYTLNTNSNFSHEKATLELDYSSRSPEESFRDSIEWFRQNKPSLLKENKKKNKKPQ